MSMRNKVALALVLAALAAAPSWSDGIQNSLTVGLGPTGAAGGDLSGTYPNPTVAKVDGVAYPASPSTNTVPVVTGSNTVTYEAVPNAALANATVTLGTTSIALGATSLTVAGLTSAQSNTVTVGAAGATLSTGEAALAKITASGTAPGAGYGKLSLVCGTNSGTAKLIISAGTSGTAVTVVDNIGAGVTGC